MTTIPVASVEPRRRSALLWLPPLIAALLVGYAGFRSWVERGTPIQVSFSHGHGLKPGDTVRYRGIAVGEVRQLLLGDQQRGVTLDLRLDSQASTLAREGTRFWIVRPQIGLAGIAGLDTLVGAHYVAIQPGPEDSPRARSFQGLDEPPVLDPAEHGRLEIILETPNRGSLQPGSAVTYRQIRIGSVLSVDLARDASSVEVRAAIETSKRGIIRHDSKFWETSGLDLEVGFSGFDLRLESLASLLTGGIAVATPNPLGEAAEDGQRFQLHPDLEEEWLEWHPAIPLGSDSTHSTLAPDAAPHSEPVAIQMEFRYGRLLARTHRREGWAIAIEDGLIVPSSLVLPPDDAAVSTVFIDGEPMDLAADNQRLLPNDLVFVAHSHPRPVWARDVRRTMSLPEDCLVYQGSPNGPLALAASRLSRSGDHFIVDSNVDLAAKDTGAAVVSNSDGMLVGVLSIDSDEMARVLPIQ